MHDTRLKRIGAMFAQVVDLMMSDVPLDERLMTLVVLTGEISSEYQAQEDAARIEATNEVWADAWSGGWDAGHARGYETGKPVQPESREPAGLICSGERPS